MDLMLDNKLANRYEVVREIGRGGMGIVYLARDPLLEREVAIKLIAPALLNAEKEERFRREARIVAKMDHPSIVPVYDIGEHEGSLFFVMPYVPGETLRALLKEGLLTLSQLIEISIQLAEALDYSHSLKIIHRDIKPENIIISRTEGLRVRITDFGIAKASFEQHITQTGALVGTISYLSPEMISEEPIDGRSDLYSLGAVLYECLCGEPPFVGKFQEVLTRIVHERPRPPHTKKPEIDEALSKIVMTCLEKSPARRPQRGKEVAEVLYAYQGNLPEHEGIGTAVFSPDTFIGQQNTVETVAIQSAQPMLSAFVGRDKELSELQRRFTLASGCECQLVLVSGEAGVGKSRLLEKFGINIKVARNRMLHGRCVDQDRAFPYQGFCEIIQEYFRSGGNSSLSCVDFSDLATELSALFPVLAEIEQLRISSLSGARISSIKSEAELHSEIRKDQDRTQIYELLARTLSRIAGGKMLVLFLEDLHTADVSLDALQYIVRRLAATPTLIVGTYRTSEIDKRHPLNKMIEVFRRNRNFVQMELAPFSADENRLFLESIFSDTTFAENLADKIYLATEGNPYFVKELVHSLLESQKLIQDETGNWVLAEDADISAEALPETVQQIIEKRIEGLSKELHEVLAIASVIGKSFDFKDLQILVEDQSNLDIDIDDAIENLVRSDLIEEERQSRNDRLIFSSGVVREVLYASLSRRRRRTLHRKYAEELERRHTGRLERVYAQLVHHFAQADETEKVITYGLKLAKRSLDAFSPEDAIWATKLVLEFLDDRSNGSPLVEGEARLLLGAAHQLAGNIDAAIKELEEAIKIFQNEEEPLVTLSAITMLADTAWEGRKFDKTRFWVEKGIDLARKNQDTESLLRLFTLGATVANLRGNTELAKEYFAEVDRLQPKLNESEEEFRGGHLVVALPATLQAWHPINIKLSHEAEVLSNTFETLITLDAQGNAAPLLCDSWHTNEEGSIFHFLLRPEIKLHDGRKLTAADVKTAFEKAIHLSTMSLPAAFAAIEGVEEFRKGAPSVTGIFVLSEDRLSIALRSPLPIYPVLLSDPKTSVVCEAIHGGFVGTGPFILRTHKPAMAVVARNDQYWKGVAPYLDSVEFRAIVSSTEIAEGFRAGGLDLVRDLSPNDLEALMRDRALRFGLIETPERNLYFILFNQHSSITSSWELRQALTQILRIPEIVRAKLGRFAYPAEGLFPPGILGFELSYRQPIASKERIQELLASSGLQFPIKLKVALHPMIKERYGILINAIFEIWASIGIHVENVTSQMAEYLQSSHQNKGIDLMIGRWAADYDDPDNFTFSLFHSQSGLFRNYYSRVDLDLLIEAARQEHSTEGRLSQYRKIQQEILSSSYLLPLFHDIDFRIASPGVRQLKLRSTPPYANYAEMRKVLATNIRKSGGGLINIALQGEVKSLEPSRVITMAQAEVLPLIFETLTRQTESARVVPWVASQYRSEMGGRRYWFKLREDIFFHDGRRVTARDVRYSFEYLLQNRESESRWLFSSLRGAQAILAGNTNHLEGFHILSNQEFIIELDQPLAFFPVLMSHPSAGIIPEGMDQFVGTWREGCVGCGPFRITRFSGSRIELEANPYYWRANYPKSDGLIFTCLPSPAGILNDFRNGRFTLISDLLPNDLETLRHDPDLASKYQETPGLSTYFIAFNTHQGPFSSENLRKRIASSIDFENLIRKNLGRSAIPAQSLLPPGLIGFETMRPAARNRGTSRQQSNDPIDVSSMINPVYETLFGSLLKELIKSFHERGLKITIADAKAEYRKALSHGSVDLFIGRWIADYPDADSFMHGLLHSERGAIGKLCGNAQLDRLIEDGRTETNYELRHNIYREIDSLIMDQVYLIPLFHEQAYRFAHTELEGFEVGLYPPLVSYEKLWIKR